jgi:hypothetical protein
MWGILDRELFEATGARKRAFRVTRDLVAVLGGVAAIVFGLTFLAAALGTIIS